MKKPATLVSVFLLTLAIFKPAVGSDDRVLVSINPVHSIVASVMSGIEEPVLLIPGIDSPHGYQMKPSDAVAFENAEVFVWVSPYLESSLIPVVANLPETKTVIELGELRDLTLIEFRESPGAHEDEHDEEEHHDEERHHDENDRDGEHSDDEEEHHGDEHGHDEDKAHHDDEGEEEHHDEEHGHDEEGEEKHHDEDHGNQHAHGRWDMHIWLDPDNAKVIAEQVATELLHIYPDHESQLSENVDAFRARLDDLKSELIQLAQPIGNSPYVVFHDAYQYLERSLRLNNVGSVTVNPELTPGARKIVELRETIAHTGAKCVFSEPQFNPEILEVIAEGTELKSSTLDPLGAQVEPGPDAYFELMRALVTSLRDCLS